jgi:hypothetical protein
MKLLTKEIIDKLPPVGSQDGKDPKTVPIVVKFFHCMSNYTWYVSEGTKTESGDWEFFGLVRGTENELGPFYLSELEGVKIMGMGIERDLHFTGHMLSEAMEARI